MAACSAVFGTFELLQSILLRLPPTDIHVAGNVCKRWRAICRRSKRLREARCERPLPLMKQSDCLDRMDGSATVYRGGKLLEINPAITERKKHLATDSVLDAIFSGRHVHYKIRERDWACPGAKVRLWDARFEYLTSPPIQAIVCTFRCFCGYLARHLTTFTIYNREGVKVGDLLDVFDKLKRQSRCGLPDMKFEVVGALCQDFVRLEKRPTPVSIPTSVPRSTKQSRFRKMLASLRRRLHALRR